MKKLLSFTLLCAAICLTSCEQTSPVELMSGYYNFTEEGTLTINGQSNDIHDEGTFVVSKYMDGGSIVFTGDFSATGMVSYTSNQFTIYDDSQTIKSDDGITYVFDYEYHDCYRYDNELRWETTATVTASYNGQKINGFYKSNTIARKK